MSEERFFEQVKGTMSGYAPEVPQGVYGKMRRALWWSNFTKLSATRFNMWYLLLLLGAGGGAYAVSNSADNNHDQITAAPVMNNADGNGQIVNAVSISDNTTEQKPDCLQTTEKCSAKCKTASKASCAPISTGPEHAIETGTIEITDASEKTAETEIPTTLVATTESKEAVIAKAAEPTAKKKGKKMTVTQYKDKEN